MNTTEAIAAVESGHTVVNDETGFIMKKDEDSNRLVDRYGVPTAIRIECMEIRR